ncbi:MAG: hypothetical protein H8E17_17445 [Deltaproteobacteria bacterium]|nr:hypothetical protein [Deltaproteobacteria bacterium]
MPNGESKNWIRFCIAIEGFRVTYDKWPDKIHVPDFFIDELKEKFSESEYVKLTSKIELIGDDSPYVAVDESGDTYSYGDEGFSDKKPDIRAEEWLDVFPDYYD